MTRALTSGESSSGFLAYDQFSFLVVILCLDHGFAKGKEKVKRNIRT